MENLDTQIINLLSNKGGLGRGDIAKNLGTQADQNLTNRLSRLYSEGKLTKTGEKKGTKWLVTTAWRDDKPTGLSGMPVPKAKSPGPSLVERAEDLDTRILNLLAKYPGGIGRADIAVNLAIPADQNLTNRLARLFSEDKVTKFGVRRGTKWLAANRGKPLPTQAVKPAVRPAPSKGLSSLAEVEAVLTTHMEDYTHDDVGTVLDYLYEASRGKWQMLDIIDEFVAAHPVVYKIDDPAFVTIVKRVCEKLYNRVRDGR